MKCSICGHENTSAARFCANCGSTLVTEPQPPVIIESEPTSQIEAAEYAGFWIRFLAAIIDAIILLAASTLLSFTFIHLAFGFGIIGFWVYHWLFIGIKGQTLGKMALGIKVVDANGDKPGLGNAALREILGKTISTVILFIGFLAIGMSDRKQGWHDEVSNTFVVKVETKKTEERDYEVP